MPEIREVSDPSREPVQAAELAVLVDLEARWENLRKPLSGAPEGPSTTQDLHTKQKAYEAFRAKLLAYNKRYRPAHVPELLLNTPARLGTWCRRMRDLYLQLEHSAQPPCPVHLVEKAYRWADRVAVRTGKDPVSRAAPPATIRAAIQDLEALARWCDELGGVATRPATVPVPTEPPHALPA
jgi:hypothetical protein